MKPDWKDIKSAPLDGEEVLLFDGRLVTSGWYSGNDIWMVPDGNGFRCWEPTHWAELPDGP